MPKFIVYSSETILYETIIEAPTEAEALVRFDELKFKKRNR